MKNMKIRDTKKRTDNRRIREGDYAKPGVTMIFTRGNNIDYMDCYLLCTITICPNICIL